MSRPARVKRRPEFLRIAKAGRKWAAPGLVLQALRRRHPEPSPRAGEPIRVGFTVSRKVGKAVERNRVRRRLRALADEMLTDAGSPGYDFVLIGRRATLTRPYGALRRDLAKALKQTGALKRGGGD